MSAEAYVDGRLAERHDDATRTVTTYGPIAFTLGLPYEPTPITPAPSGTILDGGTL